MADRSVEIRLTFDDSGAIRSIESLDRRIEQLGTGTERAASAGTLGFGKMAGAFFTADAAARVLFGTIGQIRDAAQAVFDTAVNALVTFEQSQLSLRATLASNIQLSDDAVENFRLMDDVADALTNKMIELDRRSLATFDELQFGLQTFIAQGGLRFVRTLEEALEATNLIVNASRIFSQQSNKQMALLTNIRGILDGQSFAMAEVAQQLANSNEDLEVQRQLWRENGSLVDFLRQELSGVDQASEEFLGTSEGLLSTWETMRDAFLREVFTSTFERIKDRAFELLTTLDEGQDRLQAIAEQSAKVSLAVFEVVEQGGRLFLRSLEFAFGSFDAFFERELQKIIFWGRVLDAISRTMDDLGNLTFRPGQLVGDLVRAIPESREEARRLTDEISRMATEFSENLPDSAEILRRSLDGILRGTQDVNRELDKTAEKFGRVAIGLPGFGRSPLPPSLLTPDERAMRALQDASTQLRLRQEQEIASALGEAAPPGGFGRDLGTPAIGIDVALGEPRELGKMQIFQEQMHGILDNLSTDLDHYRFALDASGEAWRQFVTGQQSLGAALRQATASTLANLSKEAFVRSIIHTAMGIAALTPWGAAQYGPAAAQFKSAALWAAAAGASGAAAAGVGGAAGVGERGGPFNPITTQPSIFGPQRLDISSINVQQTARLNTTLTRLDSSIQRLESMPTDEVVRMGARRAGGFSQLMDGRDVNNLSQRILDNPRAR